MRQIYKKILITLLLSIITLSLGFYAGNRNAEDIIFQTIDFIEISKEVRVYRDELGVPTIIAENIADLAFVQGYEFARDRTWQLEQYRAIVNGELSRLFGSDLREVDVFIRTIGFKRAAEQAFQTISPEVQTVLEMYVSGINRYFERHEFNLPIEYVLLGVDPLEWTVVDVLAMQGVMAFNFAFSGMENELLRQEVIDKVGGNRSLELFPVEYQPAIDYLINSSIPLNFGMINNPLNAFLGLPNFAPNAASNSWVIGGSKTKSGNPMIANDPHLGLEAPSFWYQVNLYLTDGSYQAQGYTIPGVPLIIIGHNQYVAWGVTSALTDGVDLFYFKSNETSYFLDNEWKQFEIITETLEIAGNFEEELTVKISEYGPMLKGSSGNEFALRWTYLEGYNRDQMFQAIFDMNFAKNINDFQLALENFVSPGLNFVFADVFGDIAYQYAGLIPIRKSGYGLIPQNGSDPQTGWIGSVPFQDQLFIKNPVKGYFVTANDRIDKRNLFYLSEAYVMNYRVDRISDVIENGTNFANIDVNSIEIPDMMKLQADNINLSVEDLLNPVLEGMKSYFISENDELIQNALTLLDSWDYRMDVDSVAALIYATYRIFLVQEILIDDLGKDTTDKMWYAGVRPVVNFLRGNLSNMWFDDLRTNAVIEDAIDIAARALKLSVDYLSELLEDDMETWEWGEVHEVTFKHVFSDTTNFFDRTLNAGPVPTNGSTFTVNSYLTAPSIVEGEINFLSSYGPSFRVIMEVENTWSNVFGILAPGISGHNASINYRDGFENWVTFSYNRWSHDIEKIKQTQQFSARFE